MKLLRAPHKVVAPIQKIDVASYIIPTTHLEAEEAAKAYKDIDEVAEASEKAGLSQRVVKLVPIGNIKG